VVKNPVLRCSAADGDKRFGDHNQRLAAICKALAHPARIAIVAHLQKRNQCVCGQIVDVLPLAQSTVSQHLKILKSSGVVKGEIEGPRTCYCLNLDVLAELKALIRKL
jgi:ArsR family transcriptional regulator, arsenate/arsenite/antimonite-responsive transcriptional repressor